MPRLRLRHIALALCCFAAALPAWAQYTSHFGRNKVQYEHFDWHILETEHFDIYYYTEMRELAEYGAAFAEEAYEELQNRFNFSLTHRPPLIFYSTNLHFRQTNITPGFIPPGVGGFFEFLKGRVVIPANGNVHQFRRVIRHELVHVFTYAKVLRVIRDHRIPPERFLPLWFTEGIAEYWSGSPDESHEMIMRDAVYSNYLVPLSNIYRIGGTYLMYKQGEALCRFMAETWGEEKLLRLMENFWMDRDFRHVMEVTFLEDFEEIDRKWQAWVRARYFREIDELQVASIEAGGVATEGFSAKPAFHRFADGSRKVYFVGNRTGYANVYEVEVDSLFRPLRDPEILIRGERTGDFESLHLFDSRMGVSADGKLAFVAKSGETDVIHVYDLVADALLATYGFDGLVALYSPAWSPEGDRLAFSSIAENGFSDLFLYDLAEDRLRPLTRDPYDDLDPAWSPDGRRIAFSSDRTAMGKRDAYNIFSYDLEEGTVSYVTFGDRIDQGPRWSPDGRRLVFTSAVRGEDGRYGAQNIWTVEAPADASPEMASSGSAAGLFDADFAEAPVGLSSGRRLRQLTNLTTSAFDPVWTRDGNLLFTGFEHMRFSIRSLPAADSLWAHPEREEVVDPTRGEAPWAFARIGAGEAGESVRYKKRFTLDLAQTLVSQNPVWGTQGGAALAFSDLLGDDKWFLTVYNNARGSSDFLRSLNLAVTRQQLHRRTNIAYGAFRFAGLRYDITDPDAAREFPTLWETIYGGFGLVSYPLSMFRRIEAGTSLSWDDKYIPWADVDRRAFLASNSLSLVHDNVLWGMNGPIEGYRGSVTTAWTTDVLYSNVNYLTLAGDLRHYWRLHRHITFASRALGRMNKGREARLFFMGGSWDLRGFPLFSVRGQKMWFTSHELRFPILLAPWLSLPALAPLGVVNLRGALFLDAAHAWNGSYSESGLTDRLRRQLNVGETLGAIGGGLRLNLFGGLVLRYDVGYRYRDGFRRQERFFKQFFFGWDF